MFQLAAASVAVLQSFGIDMHENLLAVAAGQFLNAARQETFRHRCQGLNPALAGPVEVFG